MSKKINLSSMKKETAQYSKKEKIQLDDSFHVHIYPLFAPSKIQQMLTEALEDHAKAIESGIEEKAINMLDWILFHLIQHFTDVDIPSELKLKLQAYAILRDSTYFSKIINSFPSESIDNVVHAAKRMIDSLKNLSSLSEEQLDKQGIDLENRDVMSDMSEMRIAE